MKRTLFISRCLHFRWWMFMWTDESSGALAPQPRRCSQAARCAAGAARERRRLRLALRSARVAPECPLTEAVRFTPLTLLRGVAAQDGRTHERQYGRAPQGERTTWRSLFLRGQRYSLLPVMSAAGLLDWKIYDGSVNSERFLQFTQECIVRAGRPALAGALTTLTRRLPLLPTQLPRMNAYPGDNSVMVLDNCRIHHSAAFKALVEDAGGYTVYTAPYTPIDNPIEHVFGKVKAWLRRNAAWVETVRASARGARPLSHLSIDTLPLLALTPRSAWPRRWTR